MESHYKNIIFSDHALQRIKKRRITQSAVHKVVNNPQSKATEDNGNTRFVREVSKRDIHVIATYLPDEKRWLIVSAWVRGEDDPKPLWLRILTLPLRLVTRRGRKS